MDSLSSSIIVVLDSFFPSSAEKLYSESEARPCVYVGKNQHYDVRIRFMQSLTTTTKRSKTFFKEPSLPTIVASDVYFCASAETYSSES